MSNLVHVGPDGLDDLHTDDAAYQVNNQFLGVPGYPALPKPVTYPTLATGFIMFWVVKWFLGHFFPMSIGFLIVTVGLTVFATRRLMKLSSFDRPVRLLPVIVAHEVASPRRPKPIHYTLHASGVKIDAYRARSKVDCGLEPSHPELLPMLERGER